MESTDLTRIFAVVTVLTLIIYADPGTAGGGSAEDTALVNLPVEEIADEFKKVRGIKGHFDGGAWNDEVDKWMGRKHRLMIGLGLRLAGGNYEKSDIIKLLDQPDRIVRKGDYLFELIISQKRYDSLTAASYEFLVYSTWNIVATYICGTNFNNGEFYNKTIYIDESYYGAFPADMKISFMCDASDNRDDVYIDEIRVSAK